jgi:hypothetical protein
MWEKQASKGTLARRVKPVSRGLKEIRGLKAKQVSRGLKVIQVLREKPGFKETKGKPALLERQAH